jgi:hypothetical protein
MCPTGRHDPRADTQVNVMHSQDLEWGRDGLDDPEPGRRVKDGAGDLGMLGSGRRPRRRLTAARRTAGLLAIFLVALVSPLVRGGPVSGTAQLGIEQDIFVNGEVIGFLDIRSVTTPDGNEGLIGIFKVFKHNPDGTTMTLKELETSLGQDHLQWFQKVTRDTDPPDDSRGNQLKVPYIDPPPNGTSTMWADEIPWYFDEHAPSDAERGGRDWSPGVLLENNINNNFGILAYHDGPMGDKGLEVSFATFLVSDYGSSNYSVLGGFSWSIKVDNDGLTHVETLEKNAPFVYTDEIYNEFGYTLVPEPSTWFLATIGLFMIGLMRGGQKGKEDIAILSNS